MKLRRLTLVKCVPKLRIDPVSFIFLACFSKESKKRGLACYLKFGGEDVGNYNDKIDILGTFLKFTSQLWRIFGWIDISLKLSFVSRKSTLRKVESLFVEKLSLINLIQEYWNLREYSGTLVFYLFIDL